MSLSLLQSGSPSWEHKKPKARDESDNTKKQTWDTEYLINNNLKHKVLLQQLINP